MSTHGITLSDLRRAGWTLKGNELVKAGPAQVSKAKTVKAFLDCPIRSEANDHGKLRDSLRRKALQKECVVRVLGEHLVGRGQPKRVTFVLLTSKQQDDDNLQRSLKVVRDQIAELCKFDDRAPIWRYEQRKPEHYEPRGVWVKVEW